MSQEGKVAFITGGLGGIGLSFGENLLQHGAKVALVDATDRKDVEEELRKNWGEERILVLKCDITNAERLRATYQKVVDTFGGLDIVINSAGVVDEVDYERMIAVNLTSVITSSYMAVERMRKDQGGRGGTLINISSVAGLHTIPYVLAYSACKGGLISFGKSLVANLGDNEKTSVKVGTICPGAVDTKLARLNPDPKLRESDITQPNLKTHLADLVKRIDSSPIMSSQRMSETLLKYLAHPDLHGSVILVTSETVTFVHPESIKDKAIEAEQK